MAQNSNSGDRKTVLLSLGRLPVALDLARGFAAAGWRVIVAEPFSMHLARMSNAVHRSLQVTAPGDDSDRYLDDMADIVTRFSVSLVLPVSEESMFVADLKSRLPGVEIFCMPRKRMLELHDKFAFVELAKRHGLAVPDSSLAEDPRAMDISRNSAVVCKPRYSSAGRHIRFYTAGGAIPRDSGLLIQQKLEGDPVSSFSIVRDGQVLATSVYRGVVNDGSVAVCFARVHDLDDIETWVRQFAERTGHTGFLAFDFMRDDAGTWRAIECNPRATSGVHFLQQNRLPDLIAGSDGQSASFRRETLLTESWSCFTAVLMSVFSRSALRRNWRYLRQARDVSWSAADPKPFLLMMVNTHRIIWGALSRRQSFAQAAVMDIEWREPPADR